MKLRDVLLLNYFERLETKLDLILTNQGVHMATVQDVQAKITALEASVTRNTDIGQSVITLVQGLAALVASLRQQLADAIAAGADPAALQAVVDAMAAMETKIEADSTAIAAAVTAGTPAA